MEPHLVFLLDPRGKNIRKNTEKCKKINSNWDFKIEINLDQLHGFNI